MDSKAVQRSALCRSRRELSNEYLLAKFGVDTAENEPLHVLLTSSPGIQVSPFAAPPQRPHLNRDVVAGLPAELGRAQLPLLRRDHVPNLEDL